MKFLGALQLILITLKLMGYITWGWALVLSPLIVYILLVGLPIIIFFIKEIKETRDL